MTEYRRPKKFASANVRLAPSRELYDGKELQPHAGIEPTRLVAFTLPSRWGNTLTYPCGRTEIIDGHGSTAEGV